MRIERRKPLAARVGVVGVGHHTYWAQFEGLLDDMHRKLTAFEAKLSANGVEAVPFGLLDNAESETHYFYRNDWLDDVNMEAPSNLEEVCDLAVAFATNNVSGTDETVGMLCAATVFNGGNTWSMDGFAQGLW